MAPYTRLRNSRKRRASSSPRRASSVGQDLETQRKTRNAAKRHESNLLSVIVNPKNREAAKARSCRPNSPVRATSVKSSRQQQQKLMGLRVGGSRGSASRLKASLHVHSAVAASNTPSMAAARQHVHAGPPHASGWRSFGIPGT